MRRFREAPRTTPAGRAGAGRGRCPSDAVSAHVAELNARNAKNLGVSSLKRGPAANDASTPSCLTVSAPPQVHHPQHQMTQHQHPPHPMQPHPPSHPPPHPPPHPPQFSPHPHQTQHQHPPLHPALPPQPRLHHTPPPPPQQNAELQRLRAQVEERDKEIAALRQAARLKDRKLDQLSNRCRKEQMRQYYRFMELEPVVELEEDSGAGEESPTSSGPPSLSPPPYPAEYWSEDSAYAQLSREHAELQRAHHALELRLKRSEGRARAAHERLRTLQAEAQELRELAELQEFRILELEGASDHNSCARSPAPDTRDVCTDTENDDVSDSGVLSLPASEDVASEDVASDTDLAVCDVKTELPYEELKEKVLAVARSLSSLEDKWFLHQIAALLDDSRLGQPASITMNHSMKSLPDYALNGDSSKFPSRIVATVPPFNEMLPSPSGPPSGPPSAPPSAANGKALSKPLPPPKPLKLVNALAASLCLRCSAELCAPPVAAATPAPAAGGGGGGGGGAAPNGALRAEIQKLTQFRLRVEGGGGSELAFCRARLSLLEDKIRLYESGGGEAGVAGAAAAEREAQLAAEVTRLTAALHKARAERSLLDEQRCELEEAENDARLRCQKLELKLQVLSEEKCDLQSKLLQERRTNTNLKSSLLESEKLHREINYLHATLSSYEERNYMLEEREAELAHQLELLVTWWPGLLVWNILRTVCALCPRPPLPLEYRKNNGEVVCREELTRRIKDLEEELMEALAKCEVERREKGTMTEVRGEHDECCKRLRQAEQCEQQLRAKLKDLEQKEKAYMETLQEADELWSELESGYQRQVEELQASEAELRARLEAAEAAQRQHRSADAEAAELEALASEAAAARRRAEEAAAGASARAAQLSEALAAADGAVERLTSEAEELKRRLGAERRRTADLQREVDAKSEAADAQHEAHVAEIEKMKSQITSLKKENEQLANESDELKLGLERLQSALKEQQEAVSRERERGERALATLSNTLAAKERELARALAAARDTHTRSARDELAEAEASRRCAPDAESEDDGPTPPSSAATPNYSTFPRTGRERTLLPPIKPPRRVKKAGEGRREGKGVVVAHRNGVLESISPPHQMPFKTRALRDGFFPGDSMEDLTKSDERNERAPTPIPRYEVDSTNKAYPEYLSSIEVNRCRSAVEAVCKPAIRGWRSQTDSLRKPRWLTELSVRVNESSKIRPLSFPIKRSILYWDNISPKVQLKFSS